MFVAGNDVLAVAGVVDVLSPPPLFLYVLQAQMVDLRSEVTEVKAEREALEREVHDQLLQLHSLQLQLHDKRGEDEDPQVIKDKLVRTG